MGTPTDLWMPFYVGDYLADTMHYTVREHGAYCLLLFAGWMAGGELDDNDADLATITRQSVAEWLAMRPRIAPKFTIADGKWRQGRQVKELAKAARIHAARVGNGRKGGRPKKLNETETKANGKLPDKLNETETEPSAKAKPNRAAKLNESQNPHSHSHNHTTPSNPSGSPVLPLGVVSFASRTSQPLPGLPPGGEGEELPRNPTAKQRVELEAREVLAFLNERTGKRFPPTDTNVGIIAARMRQGFTAVQLRQVVALKVRAWNTDPDKREWLRPSTLFGREKFSNYVGELVAAEGPADEVKGVAP